MISLLSLFVFTAAADPCGMVPPAMLTSTQAPELRRSGDLTTFAFYKDGMQDVVVRPGFTGNVADFGMLIPFPTAPSIRKTPDAAFEHLAAAVDPPVVTVAQRMRFAMMMSTSQNEESLSEIPSGFAQIHANPLPVVRVLNEDTIGMYEVAVLEAGSAEVLADWLAEHDYGYPDGMDAVVGDYVDAGWVFVAVKAKLVDVDTTAPRPGITTLNARIQPGAVFEGEVQGMGFRFRSDALVIPMRLAAFNDAPPKNLVYVLSDDPLKIDGMDEALVRRQVAGPRLYRNLTEPLRVHGSHGLPVEIRTPKIEAASDPAPYNGIAADLFAGNLLAARSGAPAVPMDARERELAEMSASLGLVGDRVDALHRAALDTELEVVADAVLGDLADMTLTVFEGDFDPAYLAEKNVTFAVHSMNADDNHSRAWTRRPDGPILYMD